MIKDDIGFPPSQKRLSVELTIGIALLFLQIVSLFIEMLINEKSPIEALSSTTVWFPVFVALFGVYCLIRSIYVCGFYKRHMLISMRKDPQVASKREGVLPFIEHPNDVGFLISNNSHEHSTIVTTKQVFIVRGDASKMAFDIDNELRELSGRLYVNNHDTEGCEILSEHPVYDLTVALGTWSPFTKHNRPDGDGRYLVQKHDKSFDIVEYKNGLFVRHGGEIYNWMVTALHPKSPLREKSELNE